MNGAVLLDDLEHFIARFVALPSEAARVAVTLWAAHTHCIGAFDSTPRLALLSPEKGSGKTRCLEVLDLVVPTPMHAVNMSAAALFRQVASKAPTLLMDEADTYLGVRVAEKHEELRGLVNAGHRRGAVAYRCVGEPSKLQVVEFPAFAAVALAGIGDLPDTIIDRSVVIRMKRRAPDERIEPFRVRQVRPEGEALRARLAAWSEENAERLESARPELPDGIVDRAADVWEPLVAVAEATSAGWPARAREAAVRLNAERHTADVSLGVLLLRDIRMIFEAQNADHLPSAALVERLCVLDESPWGDLRGKALDARGLARRLKPFGVAPKTIRFEDRTPRGYERADFHDAWVRYLPYTSQEAQQAQQAQQGSAGAAHRVAEPLRVADASKTGSASATGNGRSTRAVAAVAAVLDSGERTAGKDADPFDYDHDDPIAPCIVCRQPCVPRRRSDGAVLHPTCALREVAS